MPSETTARIPREQIDDGATAQRARPVVELRDVNKTYPGTSTPAVADVNITISEGEFFSILGSSGSGKTTTLRMIAGFEQPTTGHVLLAGTDVNGVPPYRREVNTVFQNYALFPHMKIRANVAYPLKMKRVAKKEIASRVEEALERVDMTPYADRLPHQLSGGQRQRIALARALVNRPRLLLLDEPLGALDLKLRETMLTVLKHLQRDVGITFVYVTHDQGEALAMSDRVAVMSRGRVEQIGSPHEIYRNPATSFVAGFIGKTNLLHCTAESSNLARAGAIQIRTAGGCPRTEGFAVSVRPESIAIGPEARGLANHYPAIVEDVVFLGHMQELIARVGDQHITLRADGYTGSPGEQIELGWSENAAVVVRESE